MSDSTNANGLFGLILGQFVLIAYLVHVTVTHLSGFERIPMAIIILAGTYSFSRGLPRFFPKAGGK